MKYEVIIHYEGAYVVECEVASENEAISIAEDKAMNVPLDELCYGVEWKVEQVNEV